MSFRLQTLLRLRIAERDERRADLAKALRAEAVLEEQRERLTGEQRELLGRQRALQSPGAANVDALLATHRYTGVLAVQAHQLAGQIVQVQAETERRRLALVEADRQVRVLEKLRERQAAAAKLQGERQAAKQYDELATIGHVRKEAAR
jgi:flagellar protein FliJ